MRYFSNQKMTATQTWILKTSVVLGMVVAVVTVLYLTPMPEHHFKSCDRPCHELDWPMICRIKLSLEVFHTLGRACEDCIPYSTNCTKKHCIIADGNRRSLLTVNRKLPGPTIRVCQNDIVVVDVTNKIPGQEFTIHWRGQNMQTTPCMDGVPMITQCPIPSYTTFQYKFRATSPGTHLWHAHSNSHISDGLFGALIVRQPELTDPQKRLYDIDNKDYTLLISEWNRNSSFSKHSMKPSLLVNGKGNLNGFIPIFTVKPGLRYRFRVGFIGGPHSCPIELSFEDHHLKIISLDGNPTVPYEATSIVIGHGERIDFVLKSNQINDVYPIQITSKCNQMTLQANLVYEDIENDLSDSNLVKNYEYSRIFQTNVCQTQIGKVCANDVQSLFVMPSSLRIEKVDRKIYLMFDHLVTEKHEFDKPIHTIPRVNNFTFTFPPSPLLNQRDDVSAKTICSDEETPERCREHDICECVHIQQLPLGGSVEIILINNGNDDEEIFHLHGYSFYIVGFRQFSNTVSLEEIKKLDEKGDLIKRNLKSPAHKDTIRVPKHSAVAIRFVANNPGYWLLRDERANHWTRGMDVVLQVGSSRDFQIPPFDFPKCGNWVGPEFFLA